MMYRSSVALALWLLLNPPVFSQSAGTALPVEKWYRVELLIFSNETTAAQDAENWPPLPQLAYPERYRFLLDPAQFAEDQQSYGNMVSIDDIGRRHFSLNFTRVRWPPYNFTDLSAENATATDPMLLPADPLAREQAIASELGEYERDLIPEAGEERVPGTESTAVPEIPSEAASEMVPELPPWPTRQTVPSIGYLLPEPFILLPKKELELAGARWRLERSGEHKALLHLGWLQTMDDEQSALPLVLDRSGDSAEWPRLQGSIQLYVSRYLHLKTALWINTPGQYLPGEWRMPAPDKAPESIVLHTEDDSLLDGGQPPWSETLSEWGLSPDQNADSAVEHEQDTAVMEFENETTSETESEATAEYPWRHAVAVEHQRRMRSGETHYLDHPLVGITIRITRLSPGEIANYADLSRMPVTEPEPIPPHD